MGALATRITKWVRSLGRNTVLLNGVVTCGADGAVSSQDCDGFTVTQTDSEAGRFTITLRDQWLKIMNVLASLEITADTAAVQAKGVVPVLRGVSESGKVAYLQYTITPTAAAAGADADVEDSSKVRITVVVSTGNLVP
jgi:hypothetical protein